MGIGHSAHKNEGWRGQLARTKRWHQRLVELRRRSGRQVSLEELDFVYAFFQNVCYLREWLQKSGEVAQKEIDDFISQNRLLGVCRDIANGTKHFTVTRPSIDADFSILREYEPGTRRGDPPGHRWLVITDAKYDLFDLADKCMALWEDFLAQGGRRRRRGPPNILLQRTEARDARPGR